MTETDASTTRVNVRYVLWFSVAVLLTAGAATKVWLHHQFVRDSAEANARWQANAAAIQPILNTLHQLMRANASEDAFRARLGAYGPVTSTAGSQLHRGGFELTDVATGYRFEVEPGMAGSFWWATKPPRFPPIDVHLWFSFASAITWLVELCALAWLAMLLYLWYVPRHRRVVGEPMAALSIVCTFVWFLNDSLQTVLRTDLGRASFWLGPSMFLISAILVLPRRKPERRLAHCEDCGYNLTGNTSGVCPECGRKVLKIGKNIDELAENLSRMSNPLDGADLR